MTFHRQVLCPPPCRPWERAAKVPCISFPRSPPPPPPGDYTIAPMSPVDVSSRNLFPQLTGVLVPHVASLPLLWTPRKGRLISWLFFPRKNSGGHRTCLARSISIRYLSEQPDAAEFFLMGRTVPLFPPFLKLCQPRPPLPVLPEPPPAETPCV